jgi:hypothetical protein
MHRNRIHTDEGTIGWHDCRNRQILNERHRFVECATTAQRHRQRDHNGPDQIELRRDTFEQKIVAAIRIWKVQRNLAG